MEQHPSAAMSAKRARTGNESYYRDSDKSTVLALEVCGIGSKRKALGTAGFGLFFLPPNRFFGYPVLTHSHIMALWFKTLEVMLIWENRDVHNEGPGFDFLFLWSRVGTGEIDGPAMRQDVSHGIGKKRCSSRKVPLPSNIFNPLGQKQQITKNKEKKNTVFPHDL